MARMGRMNARSDRTLMCSRLLGCFARDRPSHYGDRGAFFFVVWGPVSCDRFLILAILLQTRETLRSSRTFSAGCADVL